MFSKGTQWLVEVLLHRDHQAAVPQHEQQAAGAAADSTRADAEHRVHPCAATSTPFGAEAEQQSKVIFA
jgi:hypothetical protein